MLVLAYAGTPTRHIKCTIKVRLCVKFVKIIRYEITNLQVTSAAIICINETENLPFTHLKVRCGHIDKSMHSETFSAVIFQEHTSFKQFT